MSDPFAYDVLSHEEQAALHQAAQEGDDKALEALWMQGTRLVQKIADRLHRNVGAISAEVEDLTQEGYASIGKSIDTWNPEKGKFSTWIGQRAEWAMLDYVNGRARYGGITGKSGTDRAVMVPDDVYKEHASTEFDTAWAEQAQLERAMSAVLTEREARVLRQIYWDGMSVSEVAKQDGVTRMTVNRLVNKALNALRLQT